MNPIRKDDIYGGYCVKLIAIYDTIETPLSIDISTGDIITPSPIKYEFNCLFNDEQTFELFGYNLETILAEKIETILRRGVFNTRIKDFYDLYMISTTKKYNSNLLKCALNNTASHRGSKEIISNYESIISDISTNIDLKDLWKKYQNQYSYAKEIEFEDNIQCLLKIMNDC